VVSTIESRIAEKSRNYLQEKEQKELGLDSETLLTRIQQLEKMLGEEPQIHISDGIPLRRVNTH